MKHVSAGPARPGRAAAGAVGLSLALAVAVAVLGGCASDDGAEPAAPAAPTSVTSTSPTSSAPPAPDEAAPEALPPPGPPAQGEVPARLVVPALGLDEQLIDLGIAADGSMEVPADFSRVGWFTGGGRPGGVGPTVIAGHVDSAVGPAVFFQLTNLVVGDRLTVTDVAGSSFEYEVYRAEDFAKNAFPTAEVFGAVLADEVRLITCTGLFDESVGHYDDNRVVFASRVP